MESEITTYRLGDTISFAATVEHNFVLQDARALFQMKGDSQPPDCALLLELLAVVIEEHEGVDNDATITSNVRFEGTVKKNQCPGEYRLTSVEGYGFDEGRTTTAPRYYMPPGTSLDVSQTGLGLRIMAEPERPSGRVKELQLDRAPSALHPPGT